MITTLLVFLLVFGAGDKPLVHVWVEIEGAVCATVSEHDPNYGGPGECYYETKVTDSRGGFGAEVAPGVHRVTVMDTDTSRKVLWDGEIDFRQEKEPYVIQTAP